MDTWAEDEAHMTAMQWESIAIDDGVEYAEQWLPGQIAHVHSYLETPEDIARYDAALKIELAKVRTEEE